MTTQRFKESHLALRFELVLGYVLLREHGETFAETLGHDSQAVLDDVRAAVADVLPLATVRYAGFSRIPNGAQEYAARAAGRVGR